MSNEEILQIPCYITGDKSLMNGSRKLTIQTQENINPEILHKIISMENKLGWFTFAMRQIKPEDLLDLPPMDITKLDIKKSPSVRLRNVLYVTFEKQGGKKENFDLWYCREMEKIIQHFKSKLED